MAAQEQIENEKIKLNLLFRQQQKNRQNVLNYPLRAAAMIRQVMKIMKRHCSVF